MRITNGIISKNFLSNLNSNMKLLDKYQTQMATNKRITKLSDDPMGVIQSMQARVKLYRIEQYQKNVDDAQTWLNQTESSVMALNDVVKSAYENAISAANGYMTAEDKQSTAALIGQLRDEVLSLGNSKIGDKYIFGGYNNISKPFALDASGNIQYNGLDLSNASDPALIAENQQVIQYEIGFGMNSTISIPGTSLMGMGDDNIYAVLDGLYQALTTNAPASEISSFAGKLQDKQGELMSLEAEIGGRTNRLTLMANRYEDDFINYTEMKSNVEDADQAEVIMQYKMAESVYLAALKVGGDIIQPSLVDYLK